MKINGVKRLTAVLFLTGTAAVLPLSQSTGAMEARFTNEEPPFAALSLLPAGDTINISLVEKTFVPGEATVKHGDAIRICNNDKFFHQPFSYSKHNQFGSPKGVRIKPGECMTHIAQNPTKQDLDVKIFDELHSNEKLTLTVLPADDAGGLTGSWSVVQTAGNGAKYTGTLSITQNGYVISGRANWSNHSQGSISGTVEGRTIKFTIQYEGGLVGSYQAVLADDGNQMINGSASSNKGGGSVSWYAGRSGR